MDNYCSDFFYFNNADSQSIWILALKLNTNKKDINEVLRFYKHKKYMTE